MVRIYVLLFTLLLIFSFQNCAENGGITASSQGQNTSKSSIGDGSQNDRRSSDLPEVITFTETQTVYEGVDVELSILLSSEPSGMEYHWSRLDFGQANLISTEFGNSYTLRNVKSTDSAIYKVAVFLDEELIHERNLELQVLQQPVENRDVAPTIQQQPQASVNLNVDGQLTLLVTASGYPQPTYQWMKDGQPVAGANQAVLTIQNITVAEAGAYTVVVSNTAGTVESSASVVAISVPECAVNIPEDTGNSARTVMVRLGESYQASCSRPIPASRNYITCDWVRRYVLGYSGTRKTYFCVTGLQVIQNEVNCDAEYNISQNGNRVPSWCNFPGSNDGA